MRRASLFLLALLAFAGAAGAQIDAGYRVTGSIINKVDGAPVRHGRITAELVRDDGVEDGSTSTSVEADGQGRFVVPLPSAGRWKVSASARGFRDAALDEHGGFYTGVVVSHGSPSVEVGFRLTPDASIAGYVLDEAGESVRNGQVTLIRNAGKTPGDVNSVLQVRGTTRTDDRGHYEFDSLAPGVYQVMVQAQPWYASGASRRNATTQADAATLDSPLDVTYPLTWYPGVTDASTAGTLTLQGGDAREADLRMLPVPSIHLRISATGQEERRGVPQIRLLSPGGGATFQPIRATFLPQGGIDIGGLAPGRYEVSHAGDGQSTSLLSIGAGSSRTIDLNSAVPMTTVALRFDLPEGVPAARIQLIDAETGQIAYSSERGGSRRPVVRYANGLPRRDEESGDTVRGGLRTREESRAGLRRVELAAGKYEVKVAGDQGEYLTGLSATGAEVAGHFVTIRGGSPQLTLHIGVGRAVLSGIATLQSKPVAAAMVLLVPASWGDPQSILLLRRCQTNTDGSFELRDVMPGRYILVAIDHGWQVHWSDAPTLDQYLIRGVPIDLAGDSRVRQSVAAAQP